MSEWTPDEVLDLMRGLVALGWPVLVGVAALLMWWCWCWSRRRPPED